MVCVWDSLRYLRRDVFDACNEKGIKLYDIRRVSIDEIIDREGIEVYYGALGGQLHDIHRDIVRLGTEHGMRGVEMPGDAWSLLYRDSIKGLLRQLTILWFHRLWITREKRKAWRDFSTPNYHFVTVSEHSKSSMLAHFPSLKPESIPVYYAAPTYADFDVAPYSTQKYVLLVSGNRQEKNALRVVRAMDELISERPGLVGDVYVYVAGATEGNYRWHPRNKAHFSFLGYVDEPTLNSLYKGAWLFAYPSINEGFGYPPLEAMRYGVPVVASPISAISEICGEAALYFNPFDYREIKARLLRMLTDESCHQMYAERGRNQYSKVRHRQDTDLQKLCRWITSGGQEK